MEKITVEELDILVQTNVKEAMKDFGKLVPEIKKQIKLIQEEFANTDLDFSEIDTKSVEESVEQVKKKTEEIKPAIKEISQEFDKVKKTDTFGKLSEEATQLKEHYSQMMEIASAKLDELQSDTPEYNEWLDALSEINRRYKEIGKEAKNSEATGFANYNVNKTEDYINSFKSGSLKNITTGGMESFLENAKTQIEEVTQELGSSIENVKPQIQEVAQEINNSLNNVDTNTFKGKIQNAIDSIKSKLSSMFSNNNEDDPLDLGETDNKIRLLNIQISQLEAKMEQVRNGKINLSDEDIAKAEVKLDELYNKRQKLEQGNSEGGFFTNLSSKISSAAGKIKQATTATAGWKNGFNQINKVSVGITNKIKQMGTKMKSGLKHVLKYAAALFSLRSIYTTLSSSASSWLSSQNAQAQQLSANIDYMKYAMGSVFAPVIEYVINLVYKLMKAIQSVVYAITKVNIFAKATASSMSSTASSAKDTSKSLAGVHDEINNVSESSSSGSDSTSPSFDLSSVDTASDFMDAIANGDWYLAGQLLAQKINGVLESIDWTSIQEKAKNIATNIGNFINGAVDGLDWSLLGSTIGNGIKTALIFVDTLLTTINFTNIGAGIATLLNSAIQTAFGDGLLGKILADIINSAIDLLYGIVTTFDWAGLGTTLATNLTALFNTTDFNKIAETLATGVNGIFEFLKNAITNFDFIGTGMTLAESINNLFSEINWGDIGTTLSDSISDILDGIIFFLATIDWNKIGSSIGEFIGNIDWIGIIEKLSIIVLEVFGGLGTSIISGVWTGIITALSNVGTWLKENIVDPIVNGFKELFGINSPSTVMAELGEFIIQGLFNGISSLIDKVIEIWTNLKATIIEKATEIKTKVVEKITELKTNAVNKITELKTSAVSKITELKTKAVSTFENLKSSITTKITNIKTTIVNGFENAVNYIKSLPSQALTWGKDIIGNIVDGITSKISDVTSAVSGVANTIKSFLGFSEPDMGPLSDFHTYMPDMIELMKKGIKDNVDSLMNEVETLSADMSYTLNVAAMPDYSLAVADVGNISSNTLRTASSIAENSTVAFSPRIIAQIGDDVIIDKVIDGINKKSERVGKSVIKVDY